MATSAQTFEALSSTTPRPELLEQYDLHPVASLWPLLSPADIQEMALDIKQHGLQEPVWMYNSQVLDGRNRLVACDMAGVRPQFQEWKPTHPGDTPISFILSKNLHRRHLSASVRAAVAVSIEQWIKDDNRRVKHEQSKIAATFSNPTSPAGPQQGTSGQGGAGAAFSGPATPGTQPTRTEKGEAVAAFSNPTARSAQPGTTEKGEVAAAFSNTGAPAATPSATVASGETAATFASPSPSGRVRDQAAAAAGVSSGYLADAKDIQKASPAMFNRLASGEITLPKAQEELVNQARQNDTLNDLTLRPGTVRAAEQRIDSRIPKPEKKPRIVVEKFSRVQSSRVAVSIEAVFGSGQKAEEWLNRMQDEPSVLRLRYDVKEAPAPTKKGALK